MRFVVYGAGAIGGVVGARLFQSGHEVVLIARGAHYEAIRDKGLRIQSPADDETLPIPVVDHPSRLTLTGRTREEAFGNVMLSRSRYYAPASHSVRFYREYFRPASERVVEKDRRRWLVVFRGVEFYVHLDRLTNPPADGFFVEVKSRTWSRRDARDKAAVIAEFLALLGARPDDTISDGYVDLIASRS